MKPKPMIFAYAGHSYVGGRQFSSITQFQVFSVAIVEATNFWLSKDSLIRKPISKISNDEVNQQNFN